MTDVNMTFAVQKNTSRGKCNFNFLPPEIRLQSTYLALKIFYTFIPLFA